MDADTYVPLLARETHRRYAFRATTREEGERWQAAFRAELARLLGLDVIALRGRPPLNAERLGREELEDHVREEWRLETEPGFHVPFFLLLPKEVAGRRPLVLTPHGHGKAGKNTYVGSWATEEERKSIEGGERDIARQAVRKGYVAIAPDMRGFASLRRRQEIEKDATSSCTELQKHALLFGRTLVGERVWDIMRLIDWAVARDDVDPQRIVISGNSGGGTVSLFAAAADPRITVAVPGSYFCTFEGSIGSIRHCACNYVPGILRCGEMYDVAALIAPRAFMAVNGREDRIFPIDAAQDAFARLQAAYEVFGAGDRCRLSVGDGGHRYYKADVWPFVGEML